MVVNADAIEASVLATRNESRNFRQGPPDRYRMATQILLIRLTPQA